MPESGDMSTDTYRDQVPRMVSIGVVAKELGVTVETIRRWESEGKIASRRTPGGQRRFDVREVERVKTGEAQS